ncbi:hypothetical protein QAD02_023232 [Eretmocerus hayati]|uniref:Uncharacterized protein n=1 Tax=Eretmocerus hayati TaxID=131215 RepID=A0ACC2PWD3_9HYME|nr:hypothetical protein QAD02_023232 [Eretmocerus hayati]
MTSYTEIKDDDYPQAPNEEDCCGNGCDPCIFDVHKRLVEEWEKKKSDKTTKLPQKNFLSLIQYQKFIVDSILKSSEDCILINLNCGLENMNKTVLMLPGQHVIIRLRTISKPYTPIFWSERSMRLLVKLYPNGVASDSFRKIKINDELQIRGPYGDFKYQSNSFKHLVMFNIGSGIAAHYPIASSIINNDSENTKVHMISGFRSLQHVPLKDEVRLLTDFWNFECTLCLSQSSNEHLTGCKIIDSKLNEEIINNFLDKYSVDSTLVLICGTTQFNENIERIVKERNFSHRYVFK